MTAVLGDFNGKSSSWYKHNKTCDRAKLEGLASHFRLQQIINESTHTLAESSYCTDLIFTSYQGTAIDYRMYPFLYSNCHIKYLLLNLTWKFIFHHLINKKWTRNMALPANIRKQLKIIFLENALRNLNTNVMIIAFKKTQKYYI